MNITELIQQLTEKIAKVANVKACFGEPVTLDQQTIVPVVSIQMCGGGGGGGGTVSTPNTKPEQTENTEEEEQEQNACSGGGGGFGMKVTPVGYIEETDGLVNFRPIIDSRMIAVLGLGSLFGIGLILRMLIKRSED